MVHYLLFAFVVQVVVWISLQGSKGHKCYFLIFNC